MRYWRGNNRMDVSKFLRSISSGVINTRAAQAECRTNGPVGTQALIIDSRAVLSTEVCRSLARLGWDVDIFAERGSPAFRSRQCRARLVSPPWKSGLPFRTRLQDAVDRGSYDAIFVASEDVLENLLPLLDTSPKWHALPLSNPESIRIALSKNRTLRCAEEAGAPIPRTFVPNGESDVEEAAKGFIYPVVIKGERGEATKNVSFVYRRGDLLTEYRRIAQRENAYGGQPAVQEFIPGAQYSLGGLFQDGNPLRVCAYRKLFTYPVNCGGLTAKAITERPPELLDAAFALFKRLHYTGFGQVQFIRDSRDGRFKFLEINPRVWASIGIAQHAGVDLYTPYLDLARGIEVRPDLSYREGVLYHRFSVEMRLMLKRPSHILSFLKDSVDPRVHSDFHWTDPGPHVPLLTEFRSLFARGEPRLSAARREWSPRSQ